MAEEVFQMKLLTEPQQKGNGNNYHFYVLGKMGPVYEARFFQGSELLEKLKKSDFVIVKGHSWPSDMTLAVPGDDAEEKQVLLKKTL